MPTGWVLLQDGCLLDRCHSISMSANLLPLNLTCLLVLCFSICHNCWYGISLLVVPAGVVPHYWPFNSSVVPHYQPCLLLVCCLTIGHAFWCGASVAPMPVGAVPHYRVCLQIWCLTIAMTFGVVPYYQQCRLVWFLTIGHACWSIATATNILQVECSWKKDGYKFGATCWYRGVIISDMSADPVPLSDIPTCTVQLYQQILTCMLG